jgi:hypothetical protein
VDGYIVLEEFTKELCSILDAKVDVLRAILVDGDVSAADSSDPVDDPEAVLVLSARKQHLDSQVRRVS